MYDEFFFLGCTSLISWEEAEDTCITIEYYWIIMT